jgi:hypothetical protein
MQNPIYIALAIFAVFILFNLYIRIRTFKLYRELVQRRIQFKFNDVFSKARWEVVKQHYPSDIDILVTFRKHMISTGILFVCVIVIVLVLASLVFIH